MPILLIIGIILLISSMFHSSAARSYELDLEEDRRHEERMEELRKLNAKKSKKTITRRRMARDEYGRFVSEELSVTDDDDFDDDDEF